MYNHSYKLGHNQFSSYTPEEFLEYVNMSVNDVPAACTNPGLNLRIKETVFAAPDKYDNRDKGLVSGVKNQGQCGSCWAFSAVQSAEGQYAKKHKLVDLSEQQVVDCDKVDQGCNGGLMHTAYEYMVKAGGLMTDKDYSYTGTGGSCNFDKTKVAAVVTGGVDLPTGDENSLKNAIYTNGPIAVAIDATIALQLYSHGIFTGAGIFGIGACTSDLSKLNHGVLAVGYDNTGGFYTIRNSWGATWGMSGYFQMKMGGNTCGVANCASYPLVQ